MHSQYKGIQLVIESFPFLTDTEKKLLDSQSSIVSYSVNETIFKEGSLPNNVYFVNEGLVKLFRDSKSSKNSIIVDVLPKARFFGLVSLLGTENYDMSAKAIAETTILTISFSAFKQIMLGNPKFAFALSTALSSQNLHIINRLIAITQKQLPGRVADVLLFFSDLYGSAEFAFPFGRLELAQFSGTSKESFIRTLSEFKNDKIIEILDARSIKIFSKDILERLSKYG